MLESRGQLASSGATQLVGLPSPTELQEMLAFERVAEPFLWWRSGLGEQVLFRLSRRQWRLTMGRSSACDVALTWDPKVSRSHALLEYLASGWTIVDDGLSKNGTYLNGRRVRARERLTDRDVLNLGDSQLCYREPMVGDPASTDAVERLPAPVLAPMQRKVLIALCRPLGDSSGALPATNREIAAELFLSVDAVKSQLRRSAEHFGVSRLPQNEKRARLAQVAIASGSILRDDFRATPNFPSGQR